LTTDASWTSTNGLLRMRTLRYALDEALASLWRGRRSGVLAVVTITAALFVLGGFLLVTSNLERLLARWREAAEFSVYLQDGAAADQRAALERLLRESGEVSALEFVSKQEALRRFNQNFGDLAGAVEGLPDNPLPASVEVRLRPGAGRTEVDALATRSRAMPGVADVRYDRRWLERLVTAVTLVRSVGFALAGILIVGAALTVASVVRLALLARRDEVEIMQLVGAPLAFIRAPFVVEGVLQGGVGAVVALGLLWSGFALARGRYGAMIAGTLDSGSLAFLSLPICAGLLVGGMLLGCAGGFVAATSAATQEK
jgi:cell division transport system permease protein